MFKHGAVAVRSAKAWLLLNARHEARSNIAIGVAFSSQSQRCLLSTDGDTPKRDFGALNVDSPAQNNNDEEHASSRNKALLAFDEKWNFHFEKLAEFVAQHGHTLVSQKYDRSLHSWVERQKNEYRKREMDHDKHQMSDHRLELLNQLGIIWERLDDRWETRYKDLCAIHHSNGHTHIQQSAHHSLYMWCTVQRREYKRLQEDATASTALTPERIEKLNRLGFLWAPSEEKWMERYTALVRYKANYGDCLVPRFFSQDPELASWVGTQREKYMKRLRLQNQNKEISPDDLGIISSRRVAMLEEIGFEWTPLATAWNSKYEILRAFVEENGFGCLPSGKASRPLFNWMQRQRKLYRERLQGKTNTLTEERIHKLDLVGFDWEDKSPPPELDRSSKSK